MLNNHFLIKRGALVYVDFGGNKGSKQGGIRPAILVANNKCNENSPVIHVVPLTSRNKKTLPTHVKVFHENLKQVSVALCEQVQLIGKDQIKDVLGYIDEMTMCRINKALDTQFDLKEENIKNNNIDIDYFKKLIYLIEEADRKYKKYKDEYFLVCKKNTQKTLQNYCKNNKIGYNKIREYAIAY